jgi:hypothetical protein
LATEFHEIEIDEESDASWQAVEFVDDNLQCDSKLAERISTWKEKVDQQRTIKDRIIPELRRRKRLNETDFMNPEAAGRSNGP